MFKASLYTKKILSDFTAITHAVITRQESIHTVFKNAIDEVVGLMKSRRSDISLILRVPVQHFEKQEQQLTIK